MTVPLLALLAHVSTPVAAGLLVLAALAVISCYTSISGLVKAELFPGEVRALGVGLPYAVANALFGGTAEYVGLWFKSVGHESGFFWYVTGFFVLALVTAWAMPETRIESHLAREYGMAARDSGLCPARACVGAPVGGTFRANSRLISLPQGPGPHHA